MSGVRKNLQSSVYFAASNTFGQFITVPIFLHYWGAQLYGSWLVLYTIPVLFSFSDAGLSSAIGNFVTLQVAAGRLRDAEAKLNAAWKFQALTWGVAFGVFCLALYFFPLRSWLGIKELSQEVFVSSSLALCLYAFVSLQVGILSSVFRASGRYNEYLNWNAHSKIIEIAFTLVALVAGGGMVWVAVSILLPRLLCLTVLYWRGRSSLQGIRLSPFSGRARDILPLVSSGLAYLVFPIAASLMNQGVILLINALDGPAAVVLLSVCRQLGRIFQQGTSIAHTAILPEMTRACGSHQEKRICQLQSAALLVPLVLGLPFALGTFCVGPSIIHWWTRKELGVTHTLVLLCSLEAVALAIGSVCCLVPWAINKVGKLSLVYVATNVIALVLARTLHPLLGISAVPLIFSIMACVYSIYGLFRSCFYGDFTLRDLFSFHEMRIGLDIWKRFRA